MSGSFKKEGKGKELDTMTTRPSPGSVTHLAPAASLPAAILPNPRLIKVSLIKVVIGTALPHGLQVIFMPFPSYQSDQDFLYLLQWKIFTS